ncbi:hypothetical protein KV205_10810 [Streptomyces sp. SKN60]|uniref:hypothetical protein n=1 Tax=Streptomyces sp. SKN60 TaxID=2855506 RepID=UPI002245E53E|nr:hypothetical protein [Streptomyces sp. SKN60]MCX2181020.1 hypothetical protein [Streptomyces sp. SKN60]
MSTRQRGWVVAGVVVAGLTALLGLVTAPLLGGLFLVTALVALIPLPMAESPKICARVCLVTGLGLLVWALVGAVIGMFLFVPAALILVTAAFVGPGSGSRPGPWFSAITPLVAVAALVLGFHQMNEVDPENEPPPYFRATVDSMDRARDPQFNQSTERLWDYGATDVQVYERAGQLVVDVNMPETFTHGRTESDLRDEIADLPGVVHVYRCDFYACTGEQP